MSTTARKVTKAATSQNSDIILTDVEASQRALSSEIAQKVIDTLGDREGGDVYLVFPKSSLADSQAISWFYPWNNSYLHDVNRELKQQGYEGFGRLSSGQSPAKIELSVRMLPGAKARMELGTRSDDESVQSGYGRTSDYSSRSPRQSSFRDRALWRALRRF